MGCGGTKKSETDNFSIEIINLDKSKSSGEFIITKKFSEIFNIKPENKIFDYFKSSSNPFLNNFCKNLENDIKLNDTISKTSLYIFYFHNKKIPKIRDLFYTKTYNPFDENILNDSLKLKKISVFLIENLKKLFLEKKDFFIELDELLKKTPSNSELSGKILSIRTDDISIDEEDLDDKKIEYQMEQDIFKDITKEICDKIINTIKDQKITSLVIKNNQFNKIENLKKLFDSFNKHEDLILFSFSNNQTLTGFEEGWKIILQFLSSAKNLRILNLSMSYVYDKYLDEIFKSLKGKKIVNLDLSSNFITFSGAKIISSWLIKNKTLKYLNLEQNTMNEFRKDGSDYIIEALRNHPRILFVDLSHMILTGFGEKIGFLINETKSLKNLRIRNTRMNIDDHKNIFYALVGNETIDIIDLGENPSGIDKSIDLLSEMIEKNKHIKDLNIDKIGINKKTLDYFLLAIKKNKFIEKIYINENKFPIKPLLDTIKDCENIKEVYFSNKDLKLSKEEVEELESFNNLNKEKKIYT